MDFLGPANSSAAFLSSNRIGGRISGNLGSELPAEGYFRQFTPSGGVELAENPNSRSREMAEILAGN